MATGQKASPRPRPDEVDRALLDALQAGLTLSETPFAEVGQRLEISEDEVISRTARLREGGIVRQISPIFDTRTLGYRSSLVAAKYPSDRLFDAAAIVSGHPGVSHNYRRTHDFNLWFTVAVSPDSELGLERTVEVLSEATSAESMRLLPTLDLYKIAVQLDMRGGDERDKKEKPARDPEDRRSDPPPPPSEADRQLIRVLQGDLPLIPQPFAPLAQAAGTDVTSILDALSRFQELGFMRRFAAILNHRRAGFGANGMAVWRAPEEQLDEIGPRMAAFRHVSHCYRRPTYPDWPYSVFTMVHARDQQQCEETIAAIAAETGLTDPADRAILYSTYEFKKIRLEYFTPDYESWERAAAAGDPLPRWARSGSE